MVKVVESRLGSYQTGELFKRRLLVSHVVILCASSAICFRFRLRTVFALHTSSGNVLEASLQHRARSLYILLTAKILAIAVDIISTQGAARYQRLHKQISWNEDPQGCFLDSAQDADHTSAKNSVLG